MHRAVAVTTEWVTVQVGAGFIIMAAQKFQATDIVVLDISIIGIIDFAIEVFMRWFERQLGSWTGKSGSFFGKSGSSKIWLWTQTLIKFEHRMSTHLETIHNLVIISYANSSTLY